MHIWTHLKEESKGKTGLGRVSRRHGGSTTGIVGKLSQQLDELGIADNTIVMYPRTTAPRSLLAGRRHDPVPRRKEHQLGRWLPGSGDVRWPGEIEPRTEINDIVSPRTGCRP